MRTLASIEVIWALFIIITVIVQIIKGAKKMSSQAPGKTDEGAPGSPREAPERGEREDELRKFLEALGGGQPQPSKPTAAPPPVPPTVRRQKQQPTVRRTRPRVPAQEPPPPPRQAAPPQESVVTRHKPTVGAVAPAMTHAQASRAQTRTNALQAMLKKELQGAAARRKAIVLREVLGPPIALRPLEWRV